MNTSINTNSYIERKQILVAGQVQGVGFRPFVYGLAMQYSLSGLVGNTSQGVNIEVQGNVKQIDLFLHDLQTKLPPLAKITSCSINAMQIEQDENKFQIISSKGSGGHAVLISADTSICADCTQDILDAQNRRYHYAFTNCTNCGPRYTITHSIPYDRATTSMACFNLCPTCQAEYEDPLNRRFHAQPNACPECGPSLWYVEKYNEQEQYSHAEATLGDIALDAVVKHLKAGKLIAIKGLGGFHLSCDASSEASIALLRERKNRPHKPLAIMVPNMDMARRIAHINPREQELLNSSEKPIVLCKKRENILPLTIAPDSENIGIVLPYTPLHIVLFNKYAQLSTNDDLQALVMTSGNAAGEPICLGNREALQRLEHIAHVFLLHNRDILVRTDDSVCKVLPDNSTAFLRRARGYVPRPIYLGMSHAAAEQEVAILGMGAELKSTICLGRASKESYAAFVSQHIGDLQNIETLAFYHEVIAHFCMLLQVEPSCIVHDLHPNFMSTQVAKEMAKKHNLPCFALQHHFAHAWSVFAEHQFNGKALALCLDGTGLGTDKSVWGGELLMVDTYSLEQKRVGRLTPFALAGGDAATKEPWRIALSLARHSDFEAKILAQNPMLAPVVLEMLKRKVNCPDCSSVGRLFDAVSAGLGLCEKTSYEGQAAIRLEQVQNNLPWTGKSSVSAILNDMHGYKLVLNEDPNTNEGPLWELDSQKLFLAALQEKEISFAARRFHVELAKGFAQMAKHAANELDIDTIALSGGAMQNATLHSLLVQMLKEFNLNVLSNVNVPSNDGGISLGQVAYGRAVLRQKQG